MLRLVIRRLVYSVLLLVLVPTLTFFLEAVVPGNVGQELLGYNASPEQIQKMNQSLGLARPIYEQYGSWLVQALHGNLGRSYYTNQSVTSILATRLPVSLSLIVPAVLVATIFGIGLGLVAGLEASNRGWFRRSIDVVAIGGMAIPGYWLAIVLVIFFSIHLHWLPAVGYVSPSSSITGWSRSLVLPVVALSVGLVTGIAKQTREQVSSIMSSDFVRSLRARGLGTRSILLRHVLRAGSVPILTVIGLSCVGALTASVFIESVFSLPGLGSAIVTAASQHDIPVILGVAVCFTVIVIVINLSIDLLYGLADPRSRSI